MTAMHIPTCEAHYLERTHDAYGLTQNGEFLCQAALGEVYDYAQRHVPEALDGLTRVRYAEECREFMLSEMRQADTDAEGSAVPAE